MPPLNQLPATPCPLAVKMTPGVSRRLQLLELLQKLHGTPVSRPRAVSIAHSVYSRSPVPCIGAVPSQLFSFSTWIITTGPPFVAR